MQVLVYGAVALALAACSTSTPTSATGSLASFSPATVLVVENRTLSRVALNAELIVEPCTESSFTKPQLDAVVERLRDRIANGDSLDVPPDAADFRSIAIARPEGATYPAVVLISAAGSSTVFAPFDRATLPACSGTAPAAPTPAVVQS
jgi:hypothetical protein